MCRTTGRRGRTPAARQGGWRTGGAAGRGLDRDGIEADRGSSDRSGAVGAGVARRASPPRGDVHGGARDEVVGGGVDDVAAAHDPRRRRRRRAGAQRRALADLPAVVDVDGELARRGDDADRVRGRLCRGRPALAVDVRPGDGGRSRLVARVDEVRCPQGAVRCRRGSGHAGGRVDRVGAAGRYRGPGGTAAGRAVGDAAADARSDDDGLAGAGVLPRPGAHAVPLRLGRQRRNDGVGERADRRVLGAG